MTKRTISDIQLSSLVAVATIVGGMAPAAINTFFVNASTSREADINLIELAISVLS